MYQFIYLKDYSEGLDTAVKYYHSKWGNEENYHFFYDAIKNSTNTYKGLPRFYLLLKNQIIIGCCGIIINDFISRHDLYPWLCGLYIEESERGQSLGNMLMEHVENDIKKAGFEKIYLTTHHDGYYEKYGWHRIEDGFEAAGGPTRIYMKCL